VISKLRWLLMPSRRSKADRHKSSLKKSLRNKRQIKPSSFKERKRRKKLKKVSERLKMTLKTWVPNTTSNRNCWRKLLTKTHTSQQMLLLFNLKLTMGTNRQKSPLRKLSSQSLGMTRKLGMPLSLRRQVKKKLLKRQQESLSFPAM